MVIYVIVKGQNALASFSDKDAAHAELDRIVLELAKNGTFILNHKPSSYTLSTGETVSVQAVEHYNSKQSSAFKRFITKHF